MCGNSNVNKHLERRVIQNIKFYTSSYTCLYLGNKSCKVNQNTNYIIYFIEYYLTSNQYFIEYYLILNIAFNTHHNTKR